MSNAIIHLITDFGFEAPEHTIAQVQLYRNFPGASIVFSPQSFRKGHALQQAIFGKLVCGHFPDNSIHILRVGTLAKLPPRFVLGHFGNQFFLAPDNGVLPLLFDDPHGENASYYQITPIDPVVNPLLQVFIPAVTNLLSSGYNVVDRLQKKEQVYRVTMPEPTISGSILRLTVIYNDFFGNAYFNLNYRDFELLRNQRKFRLMINHYTEINKLSLDYNDVPEGHPICTFGHGGLLQVAVNAGSSAQLLELLEGKNVMLEFIDNL
jgi:S-adenosylmethionine hydrolase